MHIRNYQPGDEQVQARIYNTAAAALPAFKPASPDEITRRYQSSDPDPASKFYAVEGDTVVGYAVFNPNGRISYPWCLPHAENARQPLLEAVLSALRQHGCSKAWVAYRKDWSSVLDFLAKNGFAQEREIRNYVAELNQLPHLSVPQGQTISPVSRADIVSPLLWHGLLTVPRSGDGTTRESIFPDDAPDFVEKFYLQNSYFDANSLYSLRQSDSDGVLGIGLAIVNSRYADPSKLDAAMPCFRLGMLGAEQERHKRVNGMFSCLFTTPQSGEVLLAEAVRRFEAAGLSHAATQAGSDQPTLSAFYDRWFQLQGTFPILARSLV